MSKEQLIRLFTAPKISQPKPNREEYIAKLSKRELKGFIFYNYGYLLFIS